MSISDSTMHSFDASSSFMTSYSSSWQGTYADVNSGTSKTNYDDSDVPSDPELEAYWASLSTADKIRGALISSLVGGGIGGLLGYLIMY